MTVSPNEERVRALQLPEWPEADRRAWEDACRPGQRLRRGGAASHLKPGTQADLARRYGYFLDHLQRAGKLQGNAKAGEQVVPEAVVAYLAELQARVGSVTAYGSIRKLRRVAEIIAPTSDFSWLREIEKELDEAKRPKSKYPKLVASSELLRAGLQLLEQAEMRSPPPVKTRRQQQWADRRRARGAAERDALKRAVLARNGLMIALLALCPIRLKNLVGLNISVSLQRIGDAWWIILGTGETKKTRADERPVPPVLWPHIERYLALHRPVLTRGRTPAAADALWISSETGEAISYKRVGIVIPKAVAGVLGVAVNAHMFRTCAATTAAALAPRSPGLASAILQHVDARTTEKHYNRASAHGAGQAYAEILRKIAHETA